jgi:hypothetical protein
MVLITGGRNLAKHLHMLDATSGLAFLLRTDIEGFDAGSASLLLIM